MISEDCIDKATLCSNKLEKSCRGVIDILITSLVRVKELQSVLDYCKDSPETVLELIGTCEELLRPLATAREDLETLEKESGEIFGYLGLSVEWDERREEWRLVEEVISNDGLQNAPDGC